MYSSFTAQWDICPGSQVRTSARRGPGPALSPLATPLATQRIFTSYSFTSRLNLTNFSAFCFSVLHCFHPNEFTRTYLGPAHLGTTSIHFQIPECLHQPFLKSLTWLQRLHSWIRSCSWGRQTTTPRTFLSKQCIDRTIDIWDSEFCDLFLR